MKIRYPLVRTLLLFIAMFLGIYEIYGQESEGDRAAKLISVPAVAVPVVSKEAGVGGKVRALVLVDETGKVTSVKGGIWPGLGLP